MVTKILSAKARLDDPAAMAALLAPIPEGTELGSRLHEPGIFARYFDEGRKCLYLISDSKTVMCFTVTDVTPMEAGAIRSQCDSITLWSAGAFQSAVERVLGPSERVQ
jgi:hypothetical protein